MMVIRIILTRDTVNSSRLGAKKRNDAAKNKPYSRKRLSELSNSSRRFRSPNDDFNHELPIANTFPAKRQFSLFESKA